MIRREMIRIGRTDYEICTHPHPTPTTVNRVYPNGDRVQVPWSKAAKVVRAYVEAALPLEGGSE